MMMLLNNLTVHLRRFLIACRPLLIDGSFLLLIFGDVIILTLKDVRPEKNIGQGLFWDIFILFCFFWLFILSVLAFGEKTLIILKNLIFL